MSSIIVVTTFSIQADGQKRHYRHFYLCRGFAGDSVAGNPVAGDSVAGNPVAGDSRQL